MDKDKQDLIIRAVKNDKNALIKLIKQEQNNIYSTLYYLKKDENDISDIMQDILIKLSKKISNLKNPNNFKSWLNQIIINSYYDYLRKNKKNAQSINLSSNDEGQDYDIADFDSNPQDKLIKRELDLIIKNSIQNLPLHYKIPIALREIQGLTYDEISNITNTSIGTVKSRIARARNMIRDDINKYSRSWDNV